ncbi:MAG: PEGA domain-containing protein [Phycisphaerae bacterium]|nr:PEGA domain-containing protein [Phycisphaerae bacterium]
MNARSVHAACAITLLLPITAGCVRRTVEITSSPPGALVLLNDREVGRTPLTAEITYYGTYDVRLRLDGHEPLDAKAEAKAPPWDWIGPDLVLELVPIDFTSKNSWHFVLGEVQTDPRLVLERAQALQARTTGEEVSADAPSNAEIEESLRREVEGAEALPGVTPSPATAPVPMPGPEPGPSLPEPIAPGGR